MRGATASHLFFSRCWKAHSLQTTFLVGWSPSWCFFTEAPTSCKWAPGPEFKGQESSMHVHCEALNNASGVLRFQNVQEAWPALEQYNTS